MRHRPCIAQSMITSKRLTRVLFVDNECTRESSHLLTSIVSKHLDRPVVFDCASDAFEALHLLDHVQYDQVFLSSAVSFFSGDAASRCSYHEACDEIAIALHQRGSGACRVILMARDPATPQTLSSHYAISIQTPFTIDSISQVIEDQCNETTQLVEADGKRKNMKFTAEMPFLLMQRIKEAPQIRGKESDLPAVPCVLRKPIPLNATKHHCQDQGQDQGRTLCSRQNKSLVVGINVASAC